MKIKLTLLTALLAMTTTACDQKPDIASQTEATGKEVAKKVQEKVQEKVQDVKETQAKVQETAQQLADKTSEVAKEAVEAGKEGMKKSATRAKTATEEALADTITHAQEITKTQTSKSRRSADNAEEEMLKEMESQNKH